MSNLWLRPDGFLAVECDYDQRNVVKEIGGRWDPINKCWTLAFTLSNLEYLLDVLDNPQLSPDIENRVHEQQEKEEKLSRLREMSAQDVPVRLLVPGLHFPAGNGLYNYQKLGVVFALTNNDGVLIADEMGLGKAQSVDSMIATPSGFVRMGDISVNDYVIGSNGQQTRVTGVFPQGEKTIYRIIFSDGASTECCDEHLWQVNIPVRKNHRLLPIVAPLRFLIDIGPEKLNGREKNWCIPLVSPVNFSPQSVPLDPYLLGLLIGDMSLKQGDKLAPCLSYLRGKKSRTKVLKKLGLWGLSSANKFIPPVYKNNTSHVRMELLRGLMDMDGTVGKCKRGRVVLFRTISETLKDDVIWICRSLGGVASARIKRTFYRNKQGVETDCHPVWIVTISLPSGIVPFHLKGKSTLYSNNMLKCSPSRAIVSIECVGKKQAQCISVEARDGLYVTDDFIVTHNTIQAIAAAILKKGKGQAQNCLVITPASLKYNWPIEIEKFTDEKYAIIDGSPEERLAQWMRNDVFFHVVNYELLLEDLFGGREFKAKENETDVERIRREERMAKASMRQRVLTGVRTRLWDIIIIDEAQAIKGAGSKRSRNVKMLHGKLRMALTGTPMDGRLEELHSIMEFVSPGLLESRTRFMQKHAITDYWGKVTGYKDIDIVRNRISHCFLRRLKKNVLAELPDKIYENRMVVLSPEEKKTYKQLASRGHVVTQDAEAMVAVIRCKQFCDTPSLIGENQLTSSKLDSLREVLEEVVVENGHKVLIFTQYKTMIPFLIEVFNSMSLKYLRIDGDTPKPDRASMQKQFNESTSIDLMVGTEAMSTGLNFTAADYVINYDDNWAPAIMNQREDRAHRIGQKNVVTVINFICKDTIEERIREVLFGKSLVTAETMGDEVDEMVLKRLGPKDIAQLL